jgi:hypothetical protein
MRRYEEIYNEMQGALLADERFTILELIKIFDNESSWCGTNYQLIRIKEYSQEITGIRSGDCQGCMIQAIKNMVRFVNKYELENPKPVTIEEVIDKEFTRRNLYENRIK